MVKGYNAQEVIKCSEWIEKCEAMEAQYNAVVAQNKSLQGELNIYKKSLEKAAEDILFLLNHSNIFDYKYYGTKEEAIVDYKKQALQELEAEND